MEDKCPKCGTWMVRVTADGLTTLCCPECGYVSSPHTDPLDAYRIATVPFEQKGG